MPSLSVPGFEGRNIEVKSRGTLGGFVVTVDGQPAPAAARKNYFVLKRNDGQTVEVGVKTSYPDPAPILVLDDQEIRTARALSPFEWVWAGFPILLLFVGGALGGMLGGIAAVTNMSLLRSDKPAAVRYGLAALVSLAAITIWVVIGSVLQHQLRR